MALTLKHATSTKTRSEKQEVVNKSFQGTYEEAAAFYESMIIGNHYAEGALTNRDLRQAEGPVWEVSVSFTRQWDDFGVETDPETAAGPTSQRLTCRMLNLPLEHHSKYRAKWNHYLIGRDEHATVIPDWYHDAKNTWIDPRSDDFKNYRWIKSLSEIPTEADADGLWWAMVIGTVKLDEDEDESETIEVPCDPWKPGVESYDLAVYEITESAAHGGKAKAGWSVQVLVNSIVAKPEMGDFGVTRPGENWKVDGANIYYDGKKWISERVYTKSGDARGWDQDIYGKVTEL